MVQFVQVCELSIYLLNKRFMDMSFHNRFAIFWVAMCQTKLTSQ
jgi:hypothetical protein